MILQGILFDLDNTLIDRRRSFAIYAHRLAAEIPLHTTEEFHELLMFADQGGYRPRDEFLRHVWQKAPWKTQITLARFREHYEGMFPICSAFMPGAIELLDELRRRQVLMGIVTNGRMTGQNPKIEVLGLRNYMKKIVISQEAGVKKPHPRIFSLALEGLGTAADATWFVGDHPTNDIVGARDAGLTPIWLRGCHDWPSEQAAPALAIDTLAELLPLLDEGPP